MRQGAGGSEALRLIQCSIRLRVLAAGCFRPGLLDQPVTLPGGDARGQHQGEEILTAIGDGLLHGGRRFLVLLDLEAALGQAKQHVPVAHGPRDLAVQLRRPRPLVRGEQKIGQSAIRFPPVLALMRLGGRVRRDGLIAAVDTRLVPAEHDQRLRGRTIPVAVAERAEHLLAGIHLAAGLQDLGAQGRHLEGVAFRGFQRADDLLRLHLPVG